MTETRFHYLSLDSDHDITTDPLEVSLDAATWVLASPTDPPPDAATMPAPPVGWGRYWWRVLIGPGQVLDPTDGSSGRVYGRLTDAVETIEVTWLLNLDPAAMPDVCWPVTIPTACTSAWAGYDPTVQQLASTAAVETLRALTAYTIGGCPVTVAPCQTGSCSVPSWELYPIHTVGGFSPALVSGTWINRACTCGAQCLPRGLDLPMPVGGIQAVTIDGAVLDPTAWRLFSGYRLVRTDGGLWPAGGVEVTYTPGRTVDGFGAAAAGLLACEYAKALTGGKCALPANARSVSRQGVTVDLIGALFPEGRTGLRLVDVFIARHNPHRLRMQPMVWSPDLPTNLYRRR